MNKQYQYHFCIVFALLCLSVFAGCSPAKRVAKTISVVPGQQILTVTPSGTVKMDVSFCIPQKYVSARNRLFVTPQLVIDDSLCRDFAPLVIDAPIYTKKMERRIALDKYRDPYGKYCQKIDNPLSSFYLEYHTQFDIPENAQSGYIRAIVSKDGCGECSGMDTLYVAGISNPVSLIDTKESLHLTWIEPEFVIRSKTREGKGEALLQFGINMHDINRFIFII